VRIELVNQMRGQGVADHGLLEHLAARRGPVVRVEELPVDPDAEDREKCEQRGGDDQRDGETAPGDRGTFRRPLIGAGGRGLLRHCIEVPEGRLRRNDARPCA
jgi:hypothetical protein